MHVTAIYPGTFDPMTLGHVDIAHRATKLFDEVIIAVADNPGKRPFFTLEERVSLATDILQDQQRIRVEPFTGLLVDHAKKVGANVIMRGLRAVSDFDYEVQIAGMNRQLSPQIETVFVSAAQDYTYLSSSLVREVASHGGDVSNFVHPLVNEALKKRQQ
ncbi:MAG: pantetheine-phosphate adenylyltransferase [Gammaproteobacteria bacterium]|nr:pantetheine-phosphate adenylyltransferase [Gammaproteobacteria bacterium]